MLSSKDWTPEQWDMCRRLTERGVFKQIFTAPQLEFYNMWKTNPEAGEYSLYCTRKIGKTFTELLIAYELCMSKDHHIGRFVFPELTMAKDVVYPILDEIKAYLPKHLWPKLWKSTHTIEFHNGNKLILGGAHPDNIDGNRGPYCTFLICDEIGFWNKSKYKYTLESVLFPQLTLTNGPIFYSTTPPEDMDHPYITETLPQLQRRELVKTFTIDDNPLLNHVDKERIRARYGGGDPRVGEASKGYRREYLCELIADESRLVVPEFDFEKHTYIEAPNQLDFFGVKTAFIGYTTMDYGVGKEDWAGILTGYLDHNKQELLIVDEKLLYNESLTPATAAVNEITQESLWFCVENELTIDCFESVGNTFKKEHNLNYKRPKKTKVPDNIAVLRNAFEQNKIKISRKCVNLIMQLQKGIWKNDDKSEFLRSETLGHLDLVMALVYKLRAVKWNRRPGQSSNVIKIGVR